MSYIVKKIIIFNCNVISEINNYCWNKEDDVIINYKLKGMNFLNNNIGSWFDDELWRFKNVNNEIYKCDGFLNLFS